MNSVASEVEIVLVSAKDAFSQSPEGLISREKRRWTEMIRASERVAEEPPPEETSRRRAHELG